MNVRPLLFKLLASFLLTSIMFSAWGMNKATIQILPQDDAIYKVSGDLGFENWNFGFVLKDVNTNIDRLEIRHYSDGKQINFVEYSASILAAYLRAKGDGKIESKGFHLSLPESSNADRLDLELFSNNKSVVTKSIKLVRFKQKNTYRFPLEGVWFISSGYDFGVEHRRHLSRGHFSYDIIKINGSGQVSSGSELEDNFAFALPVLSPASGTIISVHDGEKDGKPGENSGTYNAIEIDHGNGEISRLVHLKMNSIIVEVGDKVVSGQKIAAVGKSGTQSVHLHFGFQRNITDVDGNKKQVPIPALFSNYYVSWNQGVNKLVKLGRPRRGQFIRQK